MNRNKISRLAPYVQFIMTQSSEKVLEHTLIRVRHYLVRCEFHGMFSDK